MTHRQCVFLTLLALPFDASSLLAQATLGSAAVDGAVRDESGAAVGNLVPLRFDQIELHLARRGHCVGGAGYRQSRYAAPGPTARNLKSGMLD